MLIPFRMLLLCLHFMLASVAGLLLGLARPFNPDNSRLCARMYALPALKILGLRTQLDIRSMSDRPQAAVIVANHLSNYDLFIFGRVVPYRTVTLGKRSLKWIPLFGQLFWLAGNVLVDRGNAASAKQAMSALTNTLQHKDTSIWIFAEGTRNLGQGMKPLKKGAFQMAIHAGVPIIPLCASTYVKHMDLRRWRSGTVILRSLPPIATQGLTLEDMPELMARCAAQMQAAIEAMDREVAA